jgi:hypothetical protein
LRHDEYSAEIGPGSPAISRIIVLNQGNGVKISAIMWGMLAANAITVVAALLYAIARWPDLAQRGPERPARKVQDAQSFGDRFSESNPYH